MLYDGRIEQRYIFIRIRLMIHRKIEIIYGINITFFSCPKPART